MVLSGLVRVINVSIAILLVLVLLAIYWLAIRPLPKTAGEIQAPISGPASIRRDFRGVPHIEAASWQDAIFLQGYATAQDRLWQMDSLRRFGSGDLAEVFGSSAVHLDEQARVRRMRSIAEADATQLNPEERTLMVEYARGVNFFIDSRHGNYPLEFSLPGHSYVPRPWTLADSVVIGLVMFRDLTDSSQFEWDKTRFLELQQGVDKARFKILFPAMQGAPVSPGSNAWAVSGAHTLSGKPILANDPHLAYGIPGTWHLVHLKAPGLDVSGAALPGIPTVISGHNAHIAWGETNLQTDVLDLYAEQIDERTGRYIYQGKPQQAQLDRQLIPVRNGKAVELNNWVTRHGPIVMGAVKSYAMRWSAAEGFSFPFLAIDRAGNWQDFRTALSSFWGPAQNFVFADRAGNIGYQAAGRVPIRRDFDGDLPLDGASGRFEWDGYIPFEQMPNVYNPPGGIVATANQNPFPVGYPYRVDGSFADPYRVRQIRSLLCSRSKLDVGDMLAIQKDVYSAYDSFLAQQAIHAFDKQGSPDELVRQAVEVLRRWNGQMEKDQPAPLITQLLNEQIGERLVSDLLPPPPPSGALRSETKLRPRPLVIETLLRERPAGWVADQNWDRFLLRSLSAALQQGRNEQGTPLTKWHWGKALRWKFTHPVGDKLPLVAAFFDIGPVEMSGAGTTVKQTTATLGPSERMVVDLGDLDRSVQNLVVGESGAVASGHYKDQWQAYYSGKSFPMQFERIDAKETLRIKPAP